MLEDHSTANNMVKSLALINHWTWKMKEVSFVLSNEALPSTLHHHVELIQTIYVTRLNSCAWHWRPSIIWAPSTTSVVFPPPIPNWSQEKPVCFPLIITMLWCYFSKLSLSLRPLFLPLPLFSPSTWPSCSPLSLASRRAAQLLPHILIKLWTLLWMEVDYDLLEDREHVSLAFICLVPHIMSDTK